MMDQCVQAPRGLFCGTLAAHTVVWVPSMLGTTFQGMLASFIVSPANAPVFVVVWTIALGISILMVIVGVRAHLRDGDSQPVAVSLLAIAACWSALYWDLYLPVDSRLIHHLNEGVYFAVIAASGANLLMAASSRVWHAGFYTAAGGGYAADHRQNLERQSGVIEDLRRELGELHGRLAEQTEILTHPGVRTAVRKLLHTDGKALGPVQFLELTAAFQRAEAVFDRLGSRR